MGMLSDARTKMKITKAATVLQAAAASGNPALLVTAFREVERLAVEVVNELSGKVSLSRVYEHERDKSLAAAYTMRQVAQAFLSTCHIEGDRLKEWNPGVAQASVEAALAAYNLAMSG